MLHLLLQLLQLLRHLPELLSKLSARLVARVAVTARHYAGCSGTEDGVGVDHAGDQVVEVLRVAVEILQPAPLDVLLTPLLSGTSAIFSFSKELSFLRLIVLYTRGWCGQGQQPPGNAFFPPEHGVLEVTLGAVTGGGWGEDGGRAQVRKMISEVRTEDRCEVCNVRM